MPLIQVRDVSDETVRALKERAAEQGISLTALLRAELDRLASRPTNAQVADRLAGRDRTDGPSINDAVDEVRRVRETS